MVANNKPIFLCVYKGHVFTNKACHTPNKQENLQPWRKQVERDDYPMVSPASGFVLLHNIHIKEFCPDDFLLASWHSRRMQHLMHWNNDIFGVWNWGAIANDKLQWTNAFGLKQTNSNRPNDNLGLRWKEGFPNGEKMG